MVDAQGNQREKQPEKDKDYQITLLVKGWLEGK